MAQLNVAFDIEDGARMKKKAGNSTISIAIISPENENIA